MSANSGTRASRSTVSLPIALTRLSSRCTCVHSASIAQRSPGTAPRGVWSYLELTMEGTSIERGVQATPLAAAGAASGSGAFTDAVAEASAGLGGAPSVVFAFPSGSAAGELDVAGASREAGAPVVGMSGNGSIGAGGAIEDGMLGAGALRFGLGRPRGEPERRVEPARGHARRRGHRARRNRRQRERDPPPASSTREPATRRTRWRARTGSPALRSRSPAVPAAAPSRFSSRVKRRSRRASSPSPLDRIPRSA